MMVAFSAHLDENMPGPNGLATACFKVLNLSVAFMFRFTIVFVDVVLD